MSQVKAKQLEGVHADQLLDNLISATVDPTVNDDVALGYKPSSVWVNTTASPNKVFICSDNSIGAAVWIEIKESSGASLTVIQALHGYSLCEVLKYNGTSYVRAQSDVQANVGIWLITKIIDANTFVISSNGYFSGLTGGTTDTTGFLSSTTPGGLVTTAPAISQPIIYWTSATTGWVLGYPSSRASVSPSSTPLGYNDLRTSFTGANWDYEGLTNNGGGIPLSGSIAVSGAAGWRYLVVDTLGVVSVETIPPAEIVVDTQQFTPAPIFNVANNGYYSSVNPTYRIIAIGFFDATNMLETISYGNGSKKNDDFWLGSSGTDAISVVSARLRYTAVFNKTCGSNINIVDNGYGFDDTYGTRVTSLKQQKLNIFGSILMSGTVVATSEVSIYKNGVVYIADIAQYYNATSNDISISYGFNFTDPLSQVGDYYTFVITGGGTANTTLTNIGATNV